MRSGSRAAVLAFCLLAGHAAGDDGAATLRLLVQSAPLAGFRYHAAAEVWDDLRVGDALALVRDPHNPHDANAIAVAWRGRRLGYVPRRDNAALAWALDRGEPLQARISRLTQHANPARRIEIEVFLQ